MKLKTRVTFTYAQNPAVIYRFMSAKIFILQVQSHRVAQRAVRCMEVVRYRTKATDIVKFVCRVILRTRWWNSENLRNLMQRRTNTTSTATSTALRVALLPKSDALRSSKKEYQDGKTQRSFRDPQQIEPPRSRVDWGAARSICTDCT